MSNAPMSNAPMSNAPTEIAELQDHLHNLTSRLFTDRVQNHIQQVRGTLYESAAEIARPSPRQKAIEASLRHMMLQPMPVYKAARRSARLFPATASFLTVPSDIRRTFLQDCLEVDMASSQLALVASLWDLPKIRAFLAAGNSFWQSMIDHLCHAFPDSRYRPALYDDVKGPLKGNTYSSIFGMWRGNLRRFGNPSGKHGTDLTDYYDSVALLEETFQAPIEEIGTAFMAHPVINDLLAARTQRLQAIRLQWRRLGLLRPVLPGRRNGRWAQDQRPHRVGGAGAGGRDVRHAGAVSGDP